MLDKAERDAQGPFGGKAEVDLAASALSSLSEDERARVQRVYLQRKRGEPVDPEEGASVDRIVARIQAIACSLGCPD